ncbi:MAG: branched-chain amino acid ABC transporter substrate-binding protein [Aestuariivirga sp.]
MSRLVAATLLAFFLGTSPAAADILIATAGPMAGANAGFGEQMRRGAQRAVDDINAAGGLRGEPLVLIVGDDACDPRKAADVATGFVTKGVKFVAGHFCSGASIPASKVYESANIVQISPASTNPKFTDSGGWNVIRVCARDDAQGTFAGHYIARHYPGKKIAILNDKSPAGLALAEKVRTALAQENVSIAFDESFTPGQKDYNDLAAKLSLDLIEIVYLGAAYADAGIIIRNLRELGSTAQFIASDSLVTEEFWNIAKESGEGTLMTFTPDPQKSRAATAVIQRFTSDGYNPEGYTLYAYAAVEAWVRAAEATGGTDSRKIADWLRAGSPVTTVLGELRFDAKGDVIDPQFTWYRWSEGKYAENSAIQ